MQADEGKNLPRDEVAAEAVEVAGDQDEIRRVVLSAQIIHIERVVTISLFGVPEIGTPNALIPDHDH
jgi:hypothetical protein